MRPAGMFRATAATEVAPPERAERHSVNQVDCAGRAPLFSKAKARARRRVWMPALCRSASP
ncbi:hypothetical protein GCM10010388_17690 [Streptomyces mauvecolor]